MEALCLPWMNKTMLFLLPKEIRRHILFIEGIAMRDGIHLAWEIVISRIKMEDRFKLSCIGKRKL